MSDTAVIQVILQAIIVTTKLAAPVLATSLAIGLLVSLAQSVTQVQEITLTFVPKLAGVALVLVVAGHWMLGQLVGFTNDLYAMIPRLIGLT